MVTTVAERVRDAQEEAVISPQTFAHIVLRTSRFEELVAWYKFALGAHASFENEMLAFLTYDHEHHRVAVLNAPGLAEQSPGAAGVHHFAFTYASMSDLLKTYERLKARGVKPILCINHGPTTSIYYADPDNNQIEFQIENFGSEREAKAFFASEAFAVNPIGVDFDPDELHRRLKAGEDEASLKVRPDIGPRGLDGVPLR